MMAHDVASSFHIGTTILPCAACDGEGRVFKSRYGGNDPDVWDAGECVACEGSGNQTCEDCGEHPAVASWTIRGKPYLICRECLHNGWRTMWMSDMVLVPRSDRDELDAVVNLLGIEDSHTTPAEAVQDILNEVERLRQTASNQEEAFRKERNIKRALIEFPDVVELINDQKPHGLTVCGMCGTWRRSPCGEGCTWSIRRDSASGFIAGCTSGRDA